MSEYTISEIDPGDSAAMARVSALLEQEGIRRDRNLDYTIGMYDEDYRMVATGSCFADTLRCMAVDSGCQGEGLMNQVVSELIQHQAAQGRNRLFLYTKCRNADIFRSLGFYDVARGQDSVLFMENRRNGFRDYLASLSNPPCDGTRGAVVMNANPFTLGHLYLLEHAASRCDQLHVFLVSEDVSLIPYAVRRRLVTEGTAHLHNLVFHDTGSYLISSATFPSYFLRDEDTVIRAHAQLDVALFVKIAQALGISTRFVGEEPFSHVTGIYNRVMAEELSRAGLDCEILPRKENDGTPISASRVRELLKQENFDALEALVPSATLDFFRSPEAAPVLARLKDAGNVVHY